MSDVTNPYRSPDFSGQPPIPAATPGVWYWYVVYCVFMALLYGSLVVGIVLVVALAPAAEIGVAETTIVVLMAGVSSIFLVPFAAAPFLPKKPWTWILGIVLIGLGLTSCLTMPACIPLLLFWFKPENQTFFGKMPKDQISLT